MCLNAPQHHAIKIPPLPDSVDGGVALPIYPTWFVDRSSASSDLMVVETTLGASLMHDLGLGTIGCGNQNGCAHTGEVHR